MDFLIFLDNIWFYNSLFGFVVFYLLAAIVFAAHFSSCDKFDNPVLAFSFNSFTVFVSTLLFWFYCFDFVLNDRFYFFSQNFQLLFMFVVICVTFCSRDFLVAKNITKYEYDLLLIFVIFSCICLAFCNEFLLVYLAIELLSLTLYIFAAFNRNSEYSTEAGLKYFVFGGIMSCILLFGLCLAYLFFGFMSFESISAITFYGYDSVFFCGFLFVLIVFLFKVGSAPFHFWICDVYEGSILSVTLLFASAPKIILFSLIYKLCFFVLFGFSSIWSLIFGFSAIVSIIIGSVSAIYQKRIKRLFAYSTIAHTGFILLAFLCASVDSSKSLIFYLVVYACLTITTFSILINASGALKTQPKYLINLSAIGSKNYIYAITFGLNIMAIAGVPPLAGFFSKFFMLLSLIGSGYYFAALIIVFFSSIACFYYIRLVKIMFFVSQSKNCLWLTNKSVQNTELIIGLLFLFVLCFFMRPNLIIDFSIAVGLALL